MNNDQLKLKSRKVLFIALAAILFVAVILAIIIVLKNNIGKSDIDSDVIELIAAYQNAVDGYTKYPEDEKEAYNLVYEKLRSMPYERVYLDGVRSLTLSSVSNSLTDKQRNNLEKVAEKTLDELNSSLERIFVDYGGDIKTYIPDMSALSPVNVETEVGSNGEYIITLYLLKSDAEKFVSDEERAILERVKSESIINNIAVNSAAASVKDGFIRVIFDVYNSYISKIVTAVNYNVNLGCEFSGNLKDIEQHNILFEICSQTEYTSAREGIYLSDKTLSISENDSKNLNFKLMLPSEINSDQYTISYKSTNDSIVSVDEKGKIKGLTISEEPVDVSVYLKINGGNSYHDTCKVRVVIPVKKIEISSSDLSLEVGKTAALTANVLPENATIKDVIWLSADETVAVVSQDGTVTAVNAGQTKIVALSSDGNYYKTCIVKID